MFGWGIMVIIVGVVLALVGILQMFPFVLVAMASIAFIRWLTGMDGKKTPNKK